MIKKLRIKFIAIAMISIAIVLLIIVGGINISNFVNTNRAINSRLELITSNFNHINDLDSPPPLDTHNNLFKPGLSRESPFDTRYFSVLIDKNGDVLEINTGKIASISTNTASEYAQLLYSKNKTEGFIDDFKYTSLPQNGSTLYIFLDCERELDTINHYLITSITISLAGLLFVFVMLCFFSKIILKPVETSYQKQKRFITDASHELKTPLTIIDANTEVLEMLQGENEWTVSNRKQVQRLCNLTEKLVFLSRMDEEENKPEMSDFNLSDAVLDTVCSFNSVATAKGKTIETNIADELHYHGDEKMIRQLISILLDNAVKYSSENGWLKVSLKTSGKNKILRISNSVDNIPKGKHDILFERFYRNDPSRNSKTGGFGIGLSIAYAIVDAHKGKISAKSEDGKSIIFSVTL